MVVQKFLLSSVPISFLFIVFNFFPGEALAQIGTNTTIVKEFAAFLGRSEVLPIPLNSGNVIRRVTRNLGIENDVTDNAGDLLNLCGSIVYFPVELACEASSPLIREFVFACYDIGDTLCGPAGDVICAASDVVSGAGSLVLELGDTVCCGVSGPDTCGLGEVGYVGPTFPGYNRGGGNQGPTTPNQGPSSPIEAEPGTPFPSISGSKVIVLN